MSQNSRRFRLGRALHAIGAIALLLAAFIVPTLFAPPKPAFTTAHITRIVAVPDEPARVVIVQGASGQIGGATIQATRLRCVAGDRLRAVMRDGNLLPDPSRCLGQPRVRSSR